MDEVVVSDEIETSRWAVIVGNMFAVVAALALLVPLVLLVANGIMRQGGWGSVPYLYEVSGYLTAVVGSLGFGYAAAHGANVSTSLLVSRLTGRIKSAALAVGMVITVSAVGFTTYALALRAQTSHEFNERHYGAEWLAIWPSRLALVVGFAVVALVVLDQLVRSVIGMKRKDEEV